MCDFKPGDEVEFVGTHDGDMTGAPPVGATGIVLEVWSAPDPEWPGVDGLLISPLALPFGRFHNADHWRKVERRNDRLTIEAFMTIPGGFEEPRRPKAPAKKRERV